MLLGPDKRPGAILSSKFSGDFVSSIVISDTSLQIIRVSDVKMSSRILKDINVKVLHSSLAPAVGFEPTTNRLTADRSTTELRWNCLAPAVSA